MLRSFRVLRIMALNVSMRSLLNTLSRALPSILNILVINLLLYLIFALIMMSLLENNLYYCKANSYGLHTVFDFGKGDCNAMMLPGAVWVNRFLNFDNIGGAVMSMFVMNSMVAWPNQLYSWVNSGPNGPIRGDMGDMGVFLTISVGMLLLCRYFMCGMITGSLFLNFKLSHKLIE